MKYTICIATFNQEDSVKICLECIANLRWAPLEVVISDNSCNKQIETYARQYGAHYLSGAETDGYAVGMNRAINKALQNNIITHVLLITGDIYLLPNSTSFMFHGPYNCVTGKILNTGDTKIPNLPKHPIHFPGNFWMLPVNPLRYLGQVFDPEYWSYGEDTDLVYRLGRINVLQDYNPLAVAVHESYGPFSLTPHVKTFYLIRNSFRNAIKYNDWLWFFKLLIGHLLFKPDQTKWVIKGILNELNIGFWRATPPQNYSELSSKS